MRALAANGSFHVALLHGVTGGGKTEVFFEAIADTPRRRRHALLMPEIALTGQFLALRQPLRHHPPQSHSDLTPRSALGSGAPIAPGALWSAPVPRCSCPLATLGLMVLDEEHDGL